MVSNKTIAGRQSLSEEQLRALPPADFNSYEKLVNERFSAWLENDNALWAEAEKNAKKRLASSVEVAVEAPRRRMKAGA